MGCGAPSKLADPVESGKKFLEEVSQKPKVHKLPSGLYFKIITPVMDPTGLSPGPRDSCRVHYHGTLTNGHVFDSSIDRKKPSTFAPNQVIKGWKEALQLMTEGEEWEVYLPPELGYGSKGAGEDIPGGAVLIFKIQLLEVLTGKPGKTAHEKLERLTEKTYEELCT